MSRVFSGIQPSGELHIGNYLGAVRYWVELQDQFECIFSIVDLHAITQPYDPANLPERTLEMAVGLLAAGLDPAKCTLFVQSQVPQHAELMWIFNTVTPVGELERMTQYKEKSASLESIPAGLLSYPILQAADILLYQAGQVPVGEDQVQHLELAREIARRWNARFGDPFRFPEPMALLTGTKRILGLDGRAKMSKSLGNTIGLLDTPEAIWEKLRPAMTDPARKTRKDAGEPELCPVVYQLHRAFSPPEVVAEVERNCRSAGWGCLDCKRVLADHVIAELAPIRERALGWKQRPDDVWDILDAGAKRCRKLAEETLSLVYPQMGISRGDRRFLYLGATASGV